jgi:hypothetical protein
MVLVEDVDLGGAASGVFAALIEARRSRAPVTVISGVLRASFHKRDAFARHPPWAAEE